MRLKFSEEFKAILVKIDSPVSKFLRQQHKKENILDTYFSEIDVGRHDGTIVYTKISSRNDNVQIGEARIGRIFKNIFLKEYFEATITPKDIEEFVNSYIACISSDELTLIEGQDLIHWYREQNYLYYDDEGSRKGPLWNSCMRNNIHNCASWMVQNKVKMLAKIVDGKLTARALIWENVLNEDNEAFNFLDRVYTIFDSDQKLFFNWAQANGYHRKTYQSYDYPNDFTDPDGVEYRTKASVSIPFPDVRGSGVPYLDTFCYVNVDGTVSTEMKDSTFLQARDPSGNRREVDRTTDAFDGELRPLSFMSQCREGYSRSVNITTANNGEAILIKNSIDIPDFGICHTDDVRTSKRYKDYIFIKDNKSIELRDGDWVYDEDAVMCIDGKYSFLYEVKHSKIHGGYVDLSAMDIEKVFSMDGTSFDWVSRDLFRIMDNVYQDQSLEAIKSLAKVLPIGGGIIPLAIIDKDDLLLAPIHVLEHSKGVTQSIEEAYYFCRNEMAKMHNSKWNKRALQLWAEKNPSDYIDGNIIESAKSEDFNLIIG